MINQLLQAVNQKPNVYLPDTPAVSSRLLRREKKDNTYTGKFHHRSVIGQLNYLEKCTRPDITYAVHQCGRFCENTGIFHFKAVEHIVKYLRRTTDKGLILPQIKISLLRYMLMPISLETGTNLRHRMMLVRLSHVRDL